MRHRSKSLIAACALVAAGFGLSQYADAGTGPLVLHAPAPYRAFDTRTTTGIKTVPGAAATVCGPSTAQALAVNLTVDQPEAAGYLVAYPANGLPGASSALNFTAGQVVANSSIVATDLTGCIRISTTAKTFVIVDITGYFSPA